jgi:uncharacterized protein (DUF1330 family)
MEPVYGIVHFRDLANELAIARIVVVAFDSMEKARAWYDSPAYDTIKPIRHSSANTRAFIVEGVTPQ